MLAREFQTDFVYQEVSYVATVNCLVKNGEPGYTVVLESEDQENYLQIELKPSRSALEDWDFVVKSDNSAFICDKELLTEIAAAIERFQRPLDNANIED